MFVCFFDYLHCNQMFLIKDT